MSKKLLSAAVVIGTLRVKYAISCICVLQDFDYANNQRLLREYHRAFQNVNKILKEKDGSLPAFWLDSFRDWLISKCLGQNFFIS